MDDQPHPLAARLDEIKGRWGSIAKARLDSMPDRSEWEDRPQKDEAVRRQLRWEQAIPKRYLWAALDDFDQGRARETMQLWADTGSPRNLIICGPVGVGKTHAAIAAARARHDHGEEVEFWPVVNLMDGLRPGSDVSDTLFARLTADADVLILDDLGRQKQSEWVAERLYAIVNQRWMDEKPVIVTTTFDQRRLTDLLGEHMVSRLAGGVDVVQLSGNDRRQDQP
jgi:DNA replication protein DnaC